MLKMINKAEGPREEGMPLAKAIREVPSNSRDESNTVVTFIAIKSTNLFLHL